MLARSVAPWLIAAVLVLSGVQTAPAAPPAFTVQSWQTEHGLPQSSVRAIAQTPDGYLWLGTFSGLVRFDGLRFKVFNLANSPDLRSDRIISMLVDRRGRLWMGTDGGGVAVREDGRFRSYTTREGLDNDLVFSLGEDESGAIWIGTYGGLGRWQDGKLESRPLPGPAPKPKITCLTTDPSGHLWLTTSVGTWRQEGAEFVKLVVPGLTGGEEFRQLMIEPSGVRWLAHDELGLFRWEGTNVQTFRLNPTLPRLAIWSIFPQPNGELWFATAGDGIYRHRAGEFDLLVKAEEFSNRDLRVLFRDREDNVWVGTEAGGLNRLNPRWVEMHPSASNIARTFRSVCDDGEGGYWLANDCNGVFRYRNGALSRFDPFPGRHCYWALRRDREGALWAATFGAGLYAWKNGEVRNWHRAQGLSSHILVSLLEDRSGGMWVGTYNAGLDFVKEGRVVNYSAKDGLSGSHLSSLAQDRNGAVWIGSRNGGGLNRFSDGKFTVFNRTNGLGNNSVRTLLADADDTLWIGTAGGLSRFRDGQFFNFTTEHGLEDSVVSQLLDDDLGNLWLGCNRGIYRHRKSELNAVAAGDAARLHALAVGKAEGLTTPECAAGSFPMGLRHSDGRLWFVMLDGFAVIDPRRVSAESPPPPALVEQVIATGPAHPLRTLIRGQAWADDTTPLIIEPGTDRLEIQYTGFHFARPAQLQFQYRLTGFDADWVEAGLGRAAVYTRVPPGRYQFQVRAAGADGVWNVQPAVLDLQLAPRFWQTGWFRGLAIAAGAGLLFLGVHWRISQTERRRLAQELFSRQLLESQENERKRIAAELHDGLGQELQLVKNRAQMALNFLGPNPELTEQLQEISASTAKAIAGTRAISYALRPPELEHFGITRAIELLVEKVAGSSGFPIEADLDSIDGRLKPEMEINLYRILQESLNNVVKHAQATNVIVTLKQENSGLQLSIFDNGSGFDAEAASAGATGRRGMGLASLKERARMLNGTLDVQSAVGKGTRVTLRLPFHSNP